MGHRGKGSGARARCAWIWIAAASFYWAAAGSGEAALREEMDYGPFQAYTVSEVTSDGGASWPNMTTKGVAVQLGTNAAILFDTELMRYGAAWTGEFLDRSQTHLTSSKGSLHARVGGQVRFRTAQAPGWDQRGNFEDPRPQRAGSLPSDWAQYRGLYRHGPAVIFHYTVGGVAVWDQPGFHTIEGRGFFTRTLHVEPSDLPMRMKVLDLGPPPVAVDRDPDGSWMSFGTTGAPALWVSAQPQSGWLGPPPMVERLQDRRIAVRLPPSDIPRVLRLSLLHDAVGVSGRSLAASAWSRPIVDPMDLCRGGPARWSERIAISGRLGAGTGAYVVDTIPAPEANPWRSWMRLVALDFFSDGRAAVATWNGDVWLVSGLDAELNKVIWKRFAAGLFEGLGLRILNDRIHVLERHQLTRLHDLNGDQEADFYENVNNAAPIGPSYHAFSFGLETDEEGNFYFARCGHRVDPDLPFNGGLIRLSADGSRLDQWAHGLRAPNGLSLGPAGQITVSDNQGNWTPASRINLIERGGFYGFVPHAHTPETPATYEPPLCWIPYEIDNSSAAQVWVDGGRWGLPDGQLLHLSYGKASLFQVLVDGTARPAQGAVVRMPLRFETGLMRGRFRPQDGQLYLAGLRGWQTSGVRDGLIQRVRYTGQPVRRPLGFRVVPGGVAIEFSEPPDAATANDLENYAVERWNYRWTDAYGSAEYSVAEPDTAGRDPVEVLEARLEPGGSTVRLRLADMAPVMQLRVQYRIDAASGGMMAGDLYATINRVPTGEDPPVD